MFFPRITFVLDHHHRIYTRHLRFDYVIADKLVGVDTDTGVKVYSGFLFDMVADINSIAPATILFSSVNDASDKIAKQCQ
jgi:hypothetical protein